MTAMMRRMPTKVMNQDDGAPSAISSYRTLVMMKAPSAAPMIEPRPPA